MTPAKDDTTTLDALVKRYGTPKAQAELARLREQAAKADEADETAALMIFAEAAAYRIDLKATPERAAFIQEAATKQATYANQRRAVAGLPPLPTLKL